jgi:argininosuccinate lyase
VQSCRGQLESSVLFWCLTVARVCAKLSADVILYSAEEFGWITLPDELSTGSSIMPQKRNPDLFELTRARAGLLQGDFAAVMALTANLPGGYHRDFQFLKTPLFRGLDTTRDVVAMMTTAIPLLGVNAERGMARLKGEVLATDEVMRRVRKGIPFRKAYREVATAVKSGKAMPAISAREMRSSRKSAGNIGNLDLLVLVDRAAQLEVVASGYLELFEVAVGKLTRGSPR